MNQPRINIRELDKLFHIQGIGNFPSQGIRYLPSPMIAVDDEGRFHLWQIRGNEIIEVPNKERIKVTLHLVLSLDNSIWCL